MSCNLGSSASRRSSPRRAAFSWRNPYVAAARSTGDANSQGDGSAAKLRSSGPLAVDAAESAHVEAALMLPVSAIERQGDETSGEEPSSPRGAAAVAFPLTLRQSWSTASCMEPTLSSKSKDPSTAAAGTSSLARGRGAALPAASASGAPSSRGSPSPKPPDVDLAKAATRSSAVRQRGISRASFAPSKSAGELTSGLPM
mmetsp:Transcript_10015/g.31375  ORF Transcript_10015/g.31375 Transcript_10015/m.31375 type:complete len:200 (-) Transcript_10015:922-1521(-)